MDKLESKAITKRKKWVFGPARLLGILGYKLLAKPRVEIHEDVERLKKLDKAKAYDYYCKKYCQRK